MIPLILALGGGGSSSTGTTTSSSSEVTEYQLMTINAASITPNLDVTNKYVFNSSGSPSNINNPLNISDGDKFTIQTNNTGVYNFASTYLLPENYTSVTLEGKSEIKATRRGTSTDIIIYSVW